MRSVGNVMSSFFLIAFGCYKVIGDVVIPTLCHFCLIVLVVVIISHVCCFQLVPIVCHIQSFFLPVLSVFVCLFVCFIQCSSLIYITYPSRRLIYYKYLSKFGRKIQDQSNTSTIELSETATIRYRVVINGCSFYMAYNIYTISQNDSTIHRY